MTAYFFFKFYVNTFILTCFKHGNNNIEINKKTPKKHKIKIDIIAYVTLRQRWTHISIHSF